MVCLPKQYTKNSVASQNDCTVTNRRYNWLGFGHVKKSTCVTSDSRSSGSSVGMNGLCYARGQNRFIVNNPDFDGIVALFTILGERWRLSAVLIVGKGGYFYAKYHQVWILCVMLECATGCVLVYFWGPN